MISHFPSPAVSRRRPGLLQGRLMRLITGVLALAVLAPEAQAKKYGGGGGKSYSSGSRSSGSGGARSGGGYSSGRSSYSSPGGSRPSAPAASGSGYDSAAARARQQADSRRRYEGSKPPPIPETRPAPAAGSASGSSLPAAGTTRGGGFFSSGRGYASGGGGSYDSGSRPYRRPSYSTGAKAAMIGAAVLAPALLVYASRPPVYYSDSYGSPFWWWLLDQPREVRADWLYHRQADVAPERRAELLRADPGLQERVDALAAQKVPVRPDYAPPGLKPDDMFTDPAADAEAAKAEAEARIQSGSGGGGSGGGLLFWITVLGGGAAVIWLLFVKRWQPAARAA